MQRTAKRHLGLLHEPKHMKIAILSLALCIFVFASPCQTAAEVHAKKLPRIGFLSSTGTPGSPLPQLDSFLQGMRDLGNAEGKNFLIELRYAEGRLDRMPTLVNELLHEKVDVILAGNNVVIRAAQKATKTIPIVMLSSVDPVEAGYIKSFARPGGNITGIAWLNREVSGKRIELLKDVFPKLSRLGVIWDADGPGPAIAVKEYEAATRAFKLELRSIEVRGPHPDFAEAFQTAKTARVEAVIIVGNALMREHAKEVLDLAKRNHLASMTEERRYVREGGLISYGVNFNNLYQRAAIYVDKIIKGAKPAILLVEQATDFEIFINLKTAKQLNLEIPRSVLLRANELVE